MLKEKFEHDISDLQNQVAVFKKNQGSLFERFQDSLNTALHSRDEELLKFENVTNQLIYDLKDWVLRKFRLGLVQTSQEHQAKQAHDEPQYVEAHGTMYERAVTKNSPKPPIQTMTATMTITTGSAIHEGAPNLGLDSREVRPSGSATNISSVENGKTVQVGTMEVKFNTPGAKVPNISSNEKEGSNL